MMSARVRSPFSVAPPEDFARRVADVPVGTWPPRVKVGGFARLGADTLALVVALVLSVVTLARFGVADLEATGRSTVASEWSWEVVGGESFCSGWSFLA